MWIAVRILGLVCDYFGLSVRNFLRNYAQFAPLGSRWLVPDSISADKHDIPGKEKENNLSLWINFHE